MCVCVFFSQLTVQVNSHFHEELCHLAHRVDIFISYGHEAESIDFVEKLQGHLQFKFSMWVDHERIESFVGCVNLVYILC